MIGERVSRRSLIRIGAEDLPAPETRGVRRL
jgi:hypothetical protein